MKTMSDKSQDEPQVEPTEEEKQEHVEAHRVFWDKLTELTDQAYQGNELSPWCLMSELLELAANIELDNDADRAEFLRFCGQVYDAQLKEREQSGSLN